MKSNVAFAKRRRLEVPATPTRKKIRIPQTCETPAGRKRPEPRTPASPSFTSPSQASAAPSSAGHDRFIPVRSQMDLEVCRHSILSGDLDDDSEFATADTKRPLQAQFDLVMKEALFTGAAPVAITPTVGRARRVFSFVEQTLSQSPAAPKPPPPSPLRLLQMGVEPNVARSNRVVLDRHVPSAPTRILDAPDLVDDYYLNLISWSKRNVLAVALGPAVYLWNAGTGEITHLLSLPPTDLVTSVRWSSDGDTLAVGTNSANVQLWDAAGGVQMRVLGGHSLRIGALAWNPTATTMLNTGGRDGLILQHDTRLAAHHTATLLGHQQEVCGLQWSPDGNALASGGNENYLCLWDPAMSGVQNGHLRSRPEVAPRLTLTEHSAAVKALAWAPFQRNLLASGGGTADKCIKLWNAQTGMCVSSNDTGSQVCSLVWSPHHRELLSSHGFSQNQLCLWRYPGLLKLKELTGHTSRVLHMDISPDGATVVSAAADETLRFWEVFAPCRSPPTEKEDKGQNRGMLSAMQLR